MPRRPVIVVAGLLLAPGCGWAPAPEPAPTHDRLLTRADGRCVVSYASDCPPSGPCEPGPDAEIVPCPKSLLSADPGQRLVMEVSRRGDGCLASFPDTCGTEHACNPPPPEPAVCPARLRPPDPEPIPEVGVVTTTLMRDGDRCRLVSHVECPPNVACNPPPPQPVPCPD